jgi:protein-L-isoaspartate O-methyltransferase
MKKEWEVLVEHLVQSGIARSAQVIRSIKTVSRDLFLSENQKRFYAIDSPLPISEGQTVSAPQL